MAIVTVLVKQYFGANRRHPEACVEASFAVTSHTYRLDAIADALNSAGSPLPALDTSRHYSLPEAVGALAGAVLGKPLPPRWRWGLEGETGWVCMTHVYPALARAALMRAHAAITGDHASGEVMHIPLMRLMGGSVAIRPTNLLMMEAAGILGLSTTYVSHRAEIFQVGEGAGSQSFYELANQQDSLIGHKIAGDKMAALELLGRVGLPTTQAVAVSTANDAVKAAMRIGFPCVVKPIDRGKGVGVTTRIKSASEITPAVDEALRFSKFPIMVENHVEGHDHRMLAVDGKLLWVYRRTPAYVIGDGSATVEALIGLENRRRDEAGDAYLRHIMMDAPLERYILEHYGLTPRMIVPAGQRVYLCGQANLAKGGTLKDVTGQVHADNRDMAVRVAALLRTSALGVDFMTPDISRSWKDTPSAIIEVNSVPGISGIGDACLALATAMPRRLSGKLPVFVVVGSDAYQQSTRMSLSAALAGRKLVVGICTYMRPMPAIRQAADPFRAVRSPEVESLLLDPRVQVLIVSGTAASIEQHGFPVHGCDVVFVESPAALGAIKPPAARVVAGGMDANAISALAQAVIEPYLASGEGGPRPVLELLTGPDKAASIRCWRVRAIPRAAFQKHLAAGAGASATGMIGREDLLDALERLACDHLRQSDRVAGGLRFFPAAADRSWDTPFVDVAVSPGPHDQDTLMAALIHGVDAVNALIAALD
jgi:D-alanine-D-alanine ligase-like ATP-grasp enzyme